MRFLYPALVSLSLSSLPALVFAENVVFLNNGLVGDKDVLDKLQARSSKHEAKVAKLRDDIIAHHAENICSVYIPKPTTATVTHVTTKIVPASTVIETAYSTAYTAVSSAKYLNQTIVATVSQTSVYVATETSVEFLTETIIEDATQTSTDVTTETTTDVITETSTATIEETSTDYLTETTIDTDTEIFTTTVATVTTTEPYSGSVTMVVPDKRGAKPPSWLQACSDEEIVEACSCIVKQPEACTVIIKRTVYIPAAAVTSTTTLLTTVSSVIPYNVTKFHNATSTAFVSLDTTTTELLSSTVTESSTSTTTVIESTTATDVESTTTTALESTTTTAFETLTTTTSTGTTTTATALVTATASVPHPCNLPPMQNIVAAGILNAVSSDYTYQFAASPGDCCIACYAKNAACNVWFAFFLDNSDGYSCAFITDYSGSAQAPPPSTISDTCPHGTPDVWLIPSGTTPHVGAPGICAGTLHTSF